MRLLVSELNLNEKVVQLLEAAGYFDILSIASADAESLRDDLVLVNQEMRASKKLPGLLEISQWISQARALQEESLSRSSESFDPHDTALVNFENDPEVLEMIAVSPLALPLPVKVLASKQVPVQEIPSAILLTAARGDVSIRVGTRSPEKTLEKIMTKTPVQHGSYISSISFGHKKEEVDLKRIRSTVEFFDPNAHLIIQETSRKSSHARSKRSSPKTKNVVESATKQNIHKVLHTNPVLVWWGAFFTVASLVMIPIGIFAAFALLLKDNGHALFHWVPSWFIVLPITVFVVGLLYFLISYQAGCRVCGQKYFVPRKCLKHNKAHHIPLLGYVFAIALHILLFRWFRCSFCGTPARLKK